MASFNNENVTGADSGEVLNSDEAIQLLVDKKGISEAEAINILYPSLQNRTGLGNGVSTFINRTKTYTHAFCDIEIGGLYEYWTDGSNRQITRLVEMWTAAVGDGSYTWNEFYLTDVTPKYPCAISTLMSRGSIEVAVDSSISGSVSAELLGSGFSASTSAGGTTYYRKTIDMELVYKTY